MNRFSLRAATLASVLAVAAFTFGTAQAGGHIPPNGTLTTWKAGNLAFEADPNSPFELAFPGPSVDIDAIFFGTQLIGAVFEFVIPNFYDPLPMKTVHVRLVGQNLGASGSDIPFVLDVLGSDAPFGVPGPSQPVFGNFIDANETPTLREEHWELFPNPDWEIVKIYVPETFELDSIQIATQSVPVPAAVWLFGSALAGLVMVRRRQAA